MMPTVVLVVWFELLQDASIWFAFRVVVSTRYIVYFGVKFIRVKETSRLKRSWPLMWRNGDVCSNISRSPRPGDGLSMGFVPRAQTPSRAFTWSSSRSAPKGAKFCVSSVRSCF